MGRRSGRDFGEAYIQHDMVMVMTMKIHFSVLQKSSVLNKNKILTDTEGWITCWQNDWNCWRWWRGSNRRWTRAATTPALPASWRTTSTSTTCARAGRHSPTPANGIRYTQFMTFILKKGRKRGSSQRVTCWNTAHTTSLRCHNFVWHNFTYLTTNDREKI